MALIRLSGAVSISIGFRRSSPNSAIKSPSELKTRKGVFNFVEVISAVEGRFWCKLRKIKLAKKMPINISLKLHKSVKKTNLDFKLIGF